MLYTVFPLPLQLLLKLYMDIEYIDINNIYMPMYLCMYMNI